MSNISQKAWDYALISIKGDVVAEANMEYLAANIQVILDIESNALKDALARARDDNVRLQAELDRLRMVTRPETLRQAQDSAPEGAPAAS